MACSSPWCLQPKAGLAGSPLSHTALAFRPSLRLSGRIRVFVPLSSLPGFSPPSHADENPDPGIPRPSMDGEIQSPAPALITRPESDRRARPILGLKPLGRRPLWKRIFFASKKVRSLILLNVVTVIYASDIPVLKEVEMTTDPALFSAVRFALTAIPFLPFALKAFGDRQTRSAGIELGFWVSLGYLTQAVGLLTSGAGRASFFSALTVVVVPLIDGLFGAAVPALTWSGALVSILGVAMLECDGSLPSVGDFLNLLSVVFFAIHMLRTEQISRSTKREKFLALLGYEVFVVAFSSAMWLFFRDIFGDLHQSTSGLWTWSAMCDMMVSFPWIPALYMGMFSTGLCLWAEIDAMRDTSAAETALVYGLEPVWGATFAWFLLGERWGSVQWIGAALILGGSLTVQILGSSPEEPKKVEEITTRHSPSNASDKKQSNLSLSTILVDSRENTTDLYRKNRKEKL